MAHPESFPLRGAAITLIASGPQRARVDAVLRRRPVKTAYVFTPDAIPDGTGAIRVSLSHIPVGLVPWAEWPEDVLLRLVDHFLYHPTLDVRIQPFAAIARSVAQGGGGDLWSAARERLGMDFFVDRDRRVTLSERWARAGRFFGTTADDLETFQRSDLWQELATWRERTFASLDGCAVCRHHPWCGGFFRALDDRPEACASWMAAMDRITQAWDRWRPGEEPSVNAPRPER